MSHELGHTPKVGGYHRGPGGEGFEDDARGVLIPARGHDEDVYLGEDATYLLLREGAVKGYPLVVTGEPTQLFHEGSIPPHLPMDGERRAELGRQHLEGPYEEVAALVGHQSSDEPESKR